MSAACIFKVGATARNNCGTQQPEAQHDYSPGCGKPKQLVDEEANLSVDRSCRVHLEAWAEGLLAVGTRLVAAPIPCKA